MLFTTKTKPKIDVQKICDLLPNCTVEVDGDDVIITTEKDLTTDLVLKNKVEAVTGKAVSKVAGTI
jgi:hypothetical protein